MPQTGGLAHAGDICGTMGNTASAEPETETVTMNAPPFVTKSGTGARE